MRGGGGRGGGGLGRGRGGGRAIARKPLRGAATSRRDSDASLCSSRPSSVSLAHAVPAGPPISDRSYQSAALRSVNAYLASISSVALRPPLPSARDITRAFDDVLARLGWSVPVGVASALEDDLPSLLAQLGCPVKLSKSALRAPGTPHAWPPLLGALNWLVQLARYSDHRDSSSSSSFAEGNNVLQYHFQSFALFMEGEDGAVEALDQEQLRQTEDQVAKHVAALESLEKEAAELEKRAEALRSGPSPREAAERERALLKDDIKKFDVMIESWKEKLASTEKLLAEKEEVLEAKSRETRRISEENEELRKRIGSQVVNVRDAERMKKEFQAMERDIAEAELGRNALEEKSWELDADIDRKQKELESLVEQANHAIRNPHKNEDLNKFYLLGKLCQLCDTGRYSATRRAVRPSSAEGRTWTDELTHSGQRKVGRRFVSALGGSARRASTTELSSERRRTKPRFGTSQVPP
ncbi:hypothetical protein Taro_047401 [Colocasia esculenta]|uniref:Kinetochore protein NDC80 n=1 Tax=Colocasia esculenta TaxID=4460 RepID=A0A843X5E2_COLES|nr:hypothetical protein [Colocasia esculenta]